MKQLFTYVLIFLSFNFLLEQNLYAAKSFGGKCGVVRKMKRKTPLCCDWEGSFNSFVQGCVDISREVFTSTDTMKIFTGVLPVYLFARYADETIHSSFYEPAFHKNVSQMPAAFHNIANKGVTALAVGLSLSPYLGLFGDDVQRTSRLLGKGVSVLSALRTIIKFSIKARSALRPWNGNYSSTERALGGFPSGHMAIATYMATLYGLQQGPKWGAPLGGFAAFTFFASVDTNRHYASQLVGGTGIGLIFGWASHKVLRSRHAKDVAISLDPDSSGRPRLGVSYEF